MKTGRRRRPSATTLSSTTGPVRATRPRSSTTWWSPACTAWWTPAAGRASRRCSSRRADCEVVGVEADLRMAEVARSHGLTVEVSAFEDWDPPGEPFDLVIAAQAWHWIHPQRGASKAAAVLRPGGRFAAFWNSYDYDVAVRRRDRRRVPGARAAPPVGRVGPGRRGVRRSSAWPRPAPSPPSRSGPTSGSRSMAGTPGSTSSRRGAATARWIQPSAPGCSPGWPPRSTASAARSRSTTPPGSAPRSASAEDLTSGQASNSAWRPFSSNSWRRVARSSSVNGT